MCKNVSLSRSCVASRTGEPERLEPHDLVGAGAILFFKEPEHFKNWKIGVGKISAAPSSSSF